MMGGGDDNEDEDNDCMFDDDKIHEYHILLVAHIIFIRSKISPISSVLSAMPIPLGTS